MEPKIKQFKGMRKLLKLIVTLVIFTTNPFSVYAQESIRGKVVYAEDETPLSNVTVRLSGTSKGITTENDGTFSIIASLEQSLIISSVGYVTKEIKITSANLGMIKLEGDDKALNPVVVVGYGTQKRINLTGSIATISGSELTKTPSASLTNTLGGRLAGMVSVEGNGTPGKTSSINLRGLSTLNNNNPLIVVDGVVRTDGFGNIDPIVVESVSILKDASAAAVYGARAANGVILITTKRGKIGKPTFTYNGWAGLQQPTLYPKLLTAYQYGIAKNEALRNQGNDPANPAQAGLFFSKEDLERFKPGVSDWYKATFKKNSVITQHDLSISGGTDITRYFVSLAYLDQGAMYDNFDFKRYNFRSNLDTKISKDFSVALNIEARQEVYDYPGFGANDIFGRVLTQDPTLPIYNKDGTPFNTNAEHPVEMYRSSGHNKNQYSIFQGTLSFEEKLSFITKGLSVRGTGSYYRQHRFNKIFVLPYNMYSEDQTGNIINIKTVGGEPYLREIFTEINNTTLNLSLNYKRTFNKHDINGLLLVEQYGSTGDNLDVRKQNFITTAKAELFASGPNNQTITGNGIINDLRRSVVGRLNYAFDNKYLVEGTFRYDGSYRFPKGKRYGFFPAFSAGWRVSEESFFKNTEALHFVNSMKIRVSKGLIGNDQVGPFQFTDSYGIVTTAGPIIDGQAQSYVNYGVYPNPNITWEKQDNNNIGVDMSFLNSKLGLVLDYFSRTTSDILWSRDRSVPATFGRTLPNENYAQVKSHGFDFTLSYQNNPSDIRAFKYNLRLIGSYATNTVTKIDDPSNALDFQKQLDRPIGFIAGYQSLGLFQSQKEADDWVGGKQLGQKSLAGDIKYEDVNKDGKITTADQVIISNYGNIPPIMYGFSGSFSWKKFDASFLIQGAAKSSLMISGSARYLFPGGGFKNSFAYLADAWSPTNTNAKYPLAWNGARPINNQNSSFWLRKAGYTRLKSIDIGYSIDLSQSNKKMQKLRLFISGYNLVTWSQMKEFDPEAERGDGSYYPQQRNFNFGINLSF